MAKKYSREDKISSAIALAKAILATDAILPHKIELLSVCIWKVTMCDGKYNLRYWSRGVYDLVQEHGSIKAVEKIRPLPLRHEHVNTRRSLITAMMDNPDDVEQIMRMDAIACNITVDEHNLLNHEIEGFERYRQADVHVWDNVDERWIV